jgi:hypothetical protein
LYEFTWLIFLETKVNGRDVSVRGKKDRGRTEAIISITFVSLSFFLSFILLSDKDSCSLWKVVCDAAAGAGDDIV